MPQFIVNGNSRRCPAGSTVADLVEALGMGDSRVAVERNGVIVPRSEWWTTRIEAGDKLEVVGAVGGG